MFGLVVGAALPEDLSDFQWLRELEEIGETEGYFSPLGDMHAAVFVDRSQEVLFVCFETMVGVRSQSETGLPLGFDVCEQKGWSHLTVLALGETWYRDRHVYGYFDRLVDEGFFEDFDRVLFYGAGMCGYAAAAFSVVAPGATVISVAPQATLERGLTTWDARFGHTRKMDFTSRYGFAPDMLEAAEAAFVIYDPGETEDAMHAAMFRGANIHRFGYRRGGAAGIDADLRKLGMVSALGEQAAAEKLDRTAFAGVMRARRQSIQYLRSVLGRLMRDKRHYLAAVFCRAVLKRHSLPRFQQALDMAQAELKASGRDLPGNKRQPLETIG